MTAVRMETLAEGVTLYLGDMRDVICLIPNVAAAVIDPPYGETSLKWDRRIPNWPALIRPRIKPTGSMWVFGSMRMFMETAAEFLQWKLSHDVVWEKHNGTGLQPDMFIEKPKPLIQEALNL
jgi:site-specific DNA-methyltransferase (adenine-specific)